MKNNEKLKNAFAAADEILFDPVDANAVTPSEEFIRKTGALVRKDRAAWWKILNTAGKRVAAAALALLIVASAAIGVMALRGDINGISAVVDSTTAGDRNLIYRSEDGEFSIWKVEPLENPIYFSRISMPISDDMINKPTDVVLGKITDVTEIFIETEHKPDDYYIEGVGYVSDLLRYRSLVSVEVKDSIKGDISAGDTVTFVFAVSSRNMEYTVDYRGKLPKVGEEYVLYLSKTSGLEEGNYYIPIADYYYNASLPCFVPYDEPQRPELLEVIGCEKETCGEEFVVALKKYYE
ncbi:MAG: hypothetical protein IKX92_02970 [Clostridia bacterium]|nr:hypothetical protein [Clostridia bacterium]